MQRDAMLRELKVNHQINSCNSSPSGTSMPMKKIKMQGNELSNSRYLPGRDRLANTPDMHKSLIHRILQSTQKSRDVKHKSQDRPPVQRLEFNDCDGNGRAVTGRCDDDWRPFPLHTDEQMGGVADLLPGYDKIMLLRAPNASR